jgi:hypothetical protein
MVRVLATLLLAPVLAAQAPSSDVAVGVFPFLVGDMTPRIAEIVTNCQTHGVDTVYVSVFRATGPTDGDLWITDSAGDWNPLWGDVRSTGAGIDLPLLIANCHAANIRVVGVLKCFADTVQPSNAAHRQYLLDVVDYLVDAWQPNGQPVYDLDGLALDYVRYVGSSGAVAQNVTGFVADVRERVGSLSLHAYLIANRSAFDGPVYNTNFNSYATVRSTLSSQYGQDWEALAPLLDVIMPMAYTADGSIYSSYASHQAYVRKTAEYARLACTLAGVPARRVCPVVKTYSSSGETTTPSTIDASITGALLGGGDGYQSFRYDLQVQNPSWWPPMAAHAVPGCNWPRPVLTATSPKLTVTADATLSSDVDQSSASLLARYDYDGDGVFDTPWANLSQGQQLVGFPSTRVAFAQVQDADGHVATTRRRYTAGSPITVFPFAINTAAGGVTTVFLDAGPAASGHTYLVLASLSGTAPGFTWGASLPVPLNIDAVTTWFAANPNGSLMNGGLGTFDAQGRATASLQWPPQVLSFLAGLSMRWSFVAQDQIGQPSCVADSVPLTLF